jgi:hypothetical protein
MKDEKPIGVLENAVAQLPEITNRPNPVKG